MMNLICQMDYILFQTFKFILSILSKNIINITSAGKTKEKEDETNERQEFYIPPEKRQKINRWHEIIILLDATSDNVPTFITVKWIKAHARSGNSDNRYKPSKQVRFKTSLL